MINTSLRQSELTPLGIYIHWPYCISKCPYCDFNSHVRRLVEESDWCNAILQELSYHHSYTKSMFVKTVFFGGGTPSLMDEKTVEKIIQHVTKLWNVPLEITLEANPNSAEISKFKNLKEIGVNRLSIGVQSLNQEDLSFLGRQHSVAEAEKAIHSALDTFDNVSIDLIYARPNQNLKAWEEELVYALSFKTHHLSLYQLTIEEGTPFEKQYKRGVFSIPESQSAFDLYSLTEDVTSAYGFKSYEVSNYAKAGYECQHNLIYWRYQPFIGVGPGAHGRLKIDSQYCATQNFKSPKKWLDIINLKKCGQEALSYLTTKECLEEKLLMGLRLLEKIQLNPMELTLLNIENIKTLSDFLIFEECGALSITPKGRLLLNKILDKIIQN